MRCVLTLNPVSKIKYSQRQSLSLYPWCCQLSKKEIDDLQKPLKSQMNLAEWTFSYPKCQINLNPGLGVEPKHHYFLLHHHPNIKLQKKGRLGSIPGPLTLCQASRYCHTSFLLLCCHGYRSGACYHNIISLARVLGS